MPEARPVPSPSESAAEAQSRPAASSSSSPRLGPGSERLERRLAQLDPWEETWIRPDARYPRLKLISTLISAVVWLAVASVPLILRQTDVLPWIPLWVGVLLPALVLVNTLIDLILLGRRARAHGYAEREDDLLVRSGLMWHRVTAVPYGRMQYVQVTNGPLEGLFGLAKLELKTASSQTNATIVGLSREDAARLREELSERGEQRLAGL